MDTEILKRHFARIGARLDVQVVPADTAPILRDEPIQRPGGKRCLH